jgi:hypothetical protein
VQQQGVQQGMQHQGIVIVIVRGASCLPLQESAEYIVDNTSLSA